MFYFTCNESIIYSMNVSLFEISKKYIYIFHEIPILFYMHLYVMCIFMELSTVIIGEKRLKTLIVSFILPAIM